MDDKTIDKNTRMAVVVELIQAMRRVFNTLIDHLPDETYEILHANLDVIQKTIHSETNRRYE